MKIEENISLKQYNTFGINVSAKYFARFNTVEELHELLEFKKLQTTNLQFPTLILGGGSNILFTKDFDGLILKNEIMGIRTVKEDEHHIYVHAGAGENWQGFVQHCIGKNWAGIENLSLIPGHVGASPIQNIGAYGVELKDIFFSLEAFHIKEKKIISFSLNDCEFAYRESVFKKKSSNQFVITGVTYRLNKEPVFNIAYGVIEQELERAGVKQLSISAVSKAIIHIRSNKLPDPSVTGNAGSFFKNPHVPAVAFMKIKDKYPNLVGYPQDNGDVKIAAGWLIEHCGPPGVLSWKGFRKGDAGCHNRQSLVLVNYGNAIGKEIYDLSEEILQCVKDKFGVELEREVNIF